ncbi:MAG: hypothetical protein E7168_03200 [Firmicutes bacterium]|nr:hypothetical protein [Bacillota bacterium]
MASSLTHAYFIMDVYDRLSVRSKELLVYKKELLKVSAQSMDVLFFYNLTNFKKGKKVRDFGTYFHNHKTYDFFETLINYIKYNHFQYDSDVMAFLYGLISHYILDSNMHPYIIYRTGEFDKNDKSTYKYNQLHGEVESFFDDYMVTIREGILSYHFPCHQFCFNLPKLGDGLIEVMDFTYKEVFGIPSFHEYYIKSVSQMKFFFRIFRYDPIGVKKAFFSIIDFLCPRSLLRKAPLSYHMKLRKYESYLNLEHKPWYNPVDKRTKSTKSLLEIYTGSLNQTVEVIHQLNQYFYYDKKINLKKLIGNKSYTTGRDCSKNNHFKFFEF